MRDRDRGREARGQLEKRKNDDTTITKPEDDIDDDDDRCLWRPPPPRLPTKRRENFLKSFLRV